MSTTTTTTATTTITAEVPSGRLTPQTERLRVDGTDPAYGDFRDDLVRDGFAIVKGAVPRERAESYTNAMHSWFESLYVQDALNIS